MMWIIGFAPKWWVEELPQWVCACVRDLHGGSPKYMGLVERMRQRQAQLAVKLGKWWRQRHNAS